MIHRILYFLFYVVQKSNKKINVVNIEHHVEVLRAVKMITKLLKNKLFKNVFERYRDRLCFNKQIMYQIIAYLWVDRCLIVVRYKITCVAIEIGYNNSKAKTLLPQTRIMFKMIWAYSICLTSHFKMINNCWLCRVGTKCEEAFINVVLLIRVKICTSWWVLKCCTLKLLM